MWPRKGEFNEASQSQLFDLNQMVYIHYIGFEILTLRSNIYRPIKIGQFRSTKFTAVNFLQLREIHFHLREYESLILQAYNDGYKDIKTPKEEKLQN